MQLRILLRYIIHARIRSSSAHVRYHTTARRFCQINTSIVQGPYLKQSTRSPSSSISGFVLVVTSRSTIPHYDVCELLRPKQTQHLVYSLMTNIDILFLKAASLFGSVQDLATDRRDEETDEEVYPTIQAQTLHKHW